MGTGWTIALVAATGIAAFYIGRHYGRRGGAALGRTPAANAHSIAPVIDPKAAAAAKIVSAAAGTGQKV